MSAADWIHCNKCYNKYQGNSKFFLTTCGHLNCQSCASKINSNDNKCIVCHTPTKAVLLSKDLGHDILAYFQPISETIDKLKKIVVFQTTNQSALLQKYFQKYNYAKSEAQRCYKIMEELRKENIRLKSMLKGRPSGGHSFVTSTPMSIVPPSPGQSIMSGIVNSPIIGNSGGQHGGNSAYGSFARGIRNNFNQSSHVVPVHNNTISSGGSVPSMNKLSFGNSAKYGYGRP